LRRTRHHRVHEVVPQRVGRQLLAHAFFGLAFKPPHPEHRLELPPVRLDPPADAIELGDRIPGFFSGSSSVVATVTSRVRYSFSTTR
jgi:hypothetical protein